jgi:integrase
MSREKRKEKRDYGQGSIAWRERDQRFEVRLRVVVEGKTKQKGIGTARTMTEARKLLDEGRKTYYLPSGEKREHGAADTAESAITRWLEKSVKPGRVSTYRLYAQHMRLYVLPVIGAKRVDSLTPADAEAIQRQAHSNGVGASTIGLTRKILTTWRSYAAKKEKLAVPDFVRDSDVLYRIKPSALPFLTPEEATQLFSVAAGSRYANAYAVMVTCGGLRINECLALRWEDIDLDKRTLHVAHSLRNMGGGVRQLGETKTEKSNRMVELSAIAVTALKAQRKAQMAEQQAAAGAGYPWLNNDKLVFTAALGAPASDSTVRKDFAHHVAAAGLSERLHLHSLRHSYATIEGAMGTPISVISEQMGHSKVSITQDLYSHVMPTMRRGAADAMDRAFGG